MPLTRSAVGPSRAPRRAWLLPERVDRIRCGCSPPLRPGANATNASEAGSQHSRKTCIPLATARSARRARPRYSFLEMQATCIRILERSRLSERVSQRVTLEPRRPDWLDIRRTGILTRREPNETASDDEPQHSSKQSAFIPRPPREREHNGDEGQSHEHQGNLRRRHARHRRSADGGAVLAGSGWSELSDGGRAGADEAGQGAGQQASRRQEARAYRLREPGPRAACRTARSASSPRRRATTRWRIASVRW